MTETWWAQVDANLSSDSCLTGGGAFNFVTNEFVQWQFPAEISKLKLDINQLECMMIVISIKLWGKSFARKRLKIYCDNLVTVTAINSGASRNNFIQNCLRELHTELALSSCELRAEFLEGSRNKISDALSRIHLNKKFKSLFHELTKDLQNVRESQVDRSIWQFALDK